MVRKIKKNERRNMWMETLVVLLHAILAITSYFACAMLYVSDLSAYHLKRGRKVNPDWVDPRFVLSIMLFFALPTLLLGGYLVCSGYAKSTAITFCIAGCLGILKGTGMIKR
jgi:hypothetical protein